MFFIFQNREIESQDRQRSHMQKFIDRFRFNAKRASLVQSRIKSLQKLPMLEAIASDPTLQFEFKEPEPIPAPVLKADEVGFKYGYISFLKLSLRRTIFPFSTLFKK
jgi:ATP-binding cassette subfamily F protein 3